jgi:two-component system chemotaxis sensor kinase CheA
MMQPSQHELRTFAEETSDRVERMRELTARMAGAAADGEGIHQLFRDAHSIKGAASALGLDGLARLAHKIEDVLDLLRSGQLALDAELAQVLSQSFELLRQLAQRLHLAKFFDVDREIRSLDENLQKALARQGSARRG